MEWIVAGVACIVLVAVAVVELRGRASGADIAPAELLERMDTQADLLVLDVRTPDEYTSGHIPGAVNINHTELSARIGELEPYKEKDIIVLCERKVRARIARRILTKAGFSRVSYLRGDMAHWRQSGHPLEFGAAGSQ